MGKTVRRRHNKDGSVTTTTTYSRKNIFGTRVVDTYTTRSQPKDKQKSPPRDNPALSKVSFSVIFLALGIFIAIPMITEGAWGALILPLIFIFIGLFKLPIVQELLGEIANRNRYRPQTDNCWICPDCDTENSNSSMTCKGCGRYK